MVSVHDIVYETFKIRALCMNTDVELFSQLTKII
jgi:hypothetical protein